MSSPGSGVLAVSRQPPSGRTMVVACSMLKNGRARAFVPHPMPLPPRPLPAVFLFYRGLPPPSLAPLRRSAVGTPVGKGMAGGGRQLRDEVGKHALDDLIEILPGGAGLRHGGAHGRRIERFAAERGADLVARVVVIALRGGDGIVARGHGG